VIEYGKQNNNGLVQNFSAFSGSVLGGLAAVWPSWRCNISHYSLGDNGNHKSQVICLICWIISNVMQKKIMEVNKWQRKVEAEE